MIARAGVGYNPNTKLTLPVDSKRDHCTGSDAAPVTLLEYGDFECPYCGRAYAIVKSVQDYFGDQMRFAFRHFPLTQVHPHAQHAAEAAEVAGAQGMFWEMHDLLYENQEALDDPSLREYAAFLELDIERFDIEMATHVHARRVREDFMSGIRSGVNGTPTFFLNGTRYDGSWELDGLVASIGELIAITNRTRRNRRYHERE
jgi:protein-disulfide isomerase